MIEIKFNIDFKKALKEVETQKLTKTLNEGVSSQVADASALHITSGKVRPKLKKTNPRGVKAPPLFDTGKLANSLKGGTSGITGISYAKDHRTEGGYPWKGIIVQKREYIVARDEGKLLIRGTKSIVDKIYKEFEQKFVNLLSKLIRKRWKRKAKQK